MDNEDKMRVAFSIIHDIQNKGYTVTSMGQEVYMFDGVFTDRDTGEVLDLNYEDFDDK